MTPDAVRELCRRAIPQALTTMFRIVADTAASPPTRLAALHRLVDLLEGKVISADEFAAARAAADVTAAEWVATVQALRAGR